MYREVCHCVCFAVRSVFGMCSLRFPPKTVSVQRSGCVLQQEVQQEEEEA